MLDKDSNFDEGDNFEITLDQVDKEIIEKGKEDLFKEQYKEIRFN